MADTTKPDKGWLAAAKKAAKSFVGIADNPENLQEDYGYGYDAVSVYTLLGSGKRQARTRAQIYQKWHYMAGDPIISTALRLHVTAALGGHETTGDTVFIEAAPEVEASGSDGRKPIVEELQKDLTAIFNRIAHQIAFNGAAFGDAYGRPYMKDKVGLVDLYTEEMVYPPLVQPYERANQTVGYVVSTGDKLSEKLKITQMVRMKMPRLLYVPQMRVVEKAAKIALTEDDIDAQPVLPSLVGGSFLDAAEESYDNLTSALTGLVGQRILNSIDENLIGANLEGMTLEQRKAFMESLKSMLTSSKLRAEKAIQENKPVTERIYHLMPTFSEKQLTQISQFNGTSGASSITIDDVMLHAKLLAGALGIDLTMLGFADLLSGGLGDGGFFRMSAQAAERSRIIRTALTQFFNDCVDLHTFAKYGWVFEDGDRPYKINFYGSISALENEKAASSERAANAGGLLLQSLDTMKNVGLPQEVNEQILSKVFKQDEDMAKLIAEGLEKAKKEAKEQADAEGGFGGGGFDGGGGEPPPDFDKPQAKPNVDLGGEGEEDGQ